MSVENGQNEIMLTDNKRGKSYCYGGLSGIVDQIYHYITETLKHASRYNVKIVYLVDFCYSQGLFHDS